MPEHVTVAIMQRDADSSRVAVNVGQCAPPFAEDAARETLHRFEHPGRWSLLACLMPADVPDFTVRPLN